MIPALLSWSGGKDAAWTLHAARMRGELEIVGLLTTLTEGHDRVSMQGIRRDVLHAQARATGLPLVEAWIPQAAGNAIYEAAFGDALAEAARRWPGVRDIAFGDLFLADIKAYRDALCARFGWTPHYPLFGRDTTQLARAMIDGGLRASLCCVDTRRLDSRFAGRAFVSYSWSDLTAPGRYPPTTWTGAADAPGAWVGVPASGGAWGGVETPTGPWIEILPAGDGWKPAE